MKTSKLRWIAIVVALLAVLAAGCALNMGRIVQHFAPKAPPFPYFKDRNAVIAEAQSISDRLETYIKAWLDGKVPPEIPDELIPVAVDRTSFQHFVLRRPSEVDPQRVWSIRQAEQIDRKGLRGYYHDPHATYLVLPTFFAPFGSKVIIEANSRTAAFSIFK